MKKAVFLDRDGVINKNRQDYVKSIEELDIFSWIANSIQQLRENGFLIFIVTNQSAINRGITTHEKVIEIHESIQTHLKQKNTFVDAFYYCPHIPDENCNCRKPKPGLILKIINEMEINPKISWVVGDSNSDLEAGLSVGCNVIKVDEHFNLSQAVKIILNS